MTGTIFALASAPGRAALAVWRLSGPDTAEAIRALTGRAVPQPRRATLRPLAHPLTGVPIDRALVLWFPAATSFTGEDSAEIHTHGGRAVAEALASALAALPGLRSAEPGEFSRRAFLNGKLDLTEAEAIADLALAETEAQRRQALAQAEGGLRTLYDGWRAALIRLRAHLEAAIEFPDEDLGDPLAGLSAQLAELRAALARHLADARRGERLRDGVTIAIVGAPNAGKSSLINVLARRDAAIVSPEAGTTRDVIEVHLDLGGYPVIVADTAGLRRAGGAIEAEGIARTRLRAESADLVVALFDASQPLDAETFALLDARAIPAWSKVDLVASEIPHPGSAQTLPLPLRERSAAQPPGEGVPHALPISIKTGAGLDTLLETLTARVRDILAETGAPPPTRARHREALTRCLEALDAATTAPEPELSAEELRRAADELGRLTGRIDIEEMLDSVFRDFCIGK